MHRLIAVISLVSLLFLIEAAKAGPTEDAAAVRAQWEQVYNSGDADKFVALYTNDSMLFGSNVLLSSGFADFTLKDGTVLPFRLTFAMVKVDGQWLIAQHHGSPVPKQ